MSSYGGGIGGASYGADYFYGGDLEAADADARDLYKTILLRRSLPRSYKRTRDSGFGLLCAVLGEADNNIGGLFGAANFLAGRFE